jgi:tRNA pseudouridine55 synthase
MSGTASVRRVLSGVLLLDKPSGFSSNHALQAAKRIFAATKAGHAGTLDPMATGLLPICFGEATKFSSTLLGANKVYEATLKLGFLSTTGDAEGEIVSTGSPFNPNLTVAAAESLLHAFRGPIRQLPPMHSALKHRGKPLYFYARKGIEVDRKIREVNIYDLRIKSIMDDQMEIVVKCSTGTYIRTLAEDIGKALGHGGAYLIALRRRVVDDFDLSHAWGLDVLEAMPAAHRDACLLPVDALLKKFPAVILDGKTTAALLQGRTVENGLSEESFGNGTAGARLRLYDSQRNFLGLGEITPELKISPKRLLVHP